MISPARVTHGRRPEIGTSGPEDAAIERARDRLAEALFAQIQARRRVAIDGVATLEAATRRVEACEAWLGLLERPLPLEA